MLRNATIPNGTLGRHGSRCVIAKLKGFVWEKNVFDLKTKLRMIFG